MAVGAGGSRTRRASGSRSAWCGPLGSGGALRRPAAQAPSLSGTTLSRRGLLDEVRRRNQQDTLGPARSQERPAVQDPWATTARRRAPERQAGREAERAPSRGRPGVRGHRGLARLPAAALDLSNRHPLHRPSDHRAHHARPGRTLRQWKSHVLARFDTHRISNGGTEAVNLIIEKTRRLAHGFRTFDHSHLRILLAASGQRAYRRPPTHA